MTDGDIPLNLLPIDIEDSSLKLKDPSTDPL